MNEAEIQRYLQEALALQKRLAAAETEEDGVWEAYAGAEKLIATLKFSVGYETPGVYAKLPSAKDPGRLIVDALGLISRSADELSRGLVVESIETLRAARNDLRSYLVQKSRSASRAADRGKT